MNNSKTPACTVAHPLTTYNQRRSWVPANNSDTTPPISADGEMFTYMIEPPKDDKSYLTDSHSHAGSGAVDNQLDGRNSDSDIRQ